MATKGHLRHLLVPDCSYISQLLHFHIDGTTHLPIQKIESVELRVVQPYSWKFYAYINIRNASFL